MATVPVAKLLLCCDITCKHSKSTQLASGVTARLGKKMTTGVYISYRTVANSLEVVRTYCIVITTTLTFAYFTSSSFP